MTANESLVCSLTIFYSGQTNGRNIHRRPSRASSVLLSSFFWVSSLFSLFLFRVSSSLSSRCCGPLCFHLLGNRHQHNSMEFECSVLLFKLFLFMKEREREWKRRVSLSHYKLWSMGIRDIALVFFFLYSLLSLLIVTNAQIHTTCSIAVVGSRGHLAIVDFNQLPSFYELQYKQKSNKYFIFNSGIFFQCNARNENFKTCSYDTGLLLIFKICYKNKKKYFK